MSILYSIIARKDVILVEFSGASGNFPLLTRNILKKIKKNDKYSISSNDYFFHLINEEDLTFLCLSESTFPKRTAFCFLEDIKARLFERFSSEQIHSGIAYSLNSEFSEILNEQMKSYNSKSKDDDLLLLKSNLREVKDIMVQNIEKILEREERIDLLVSKTQTLSMTSFNLRKQGTQVKVQAKNRNMKLKIILVVMLMVFIYLLIARICGSFTLSNC